MWFSLKLSHVGQFSGCLAVLILDLAALTWASVKITHENFHQQLRQTRKVQIKWMPHHLFILLWSGVARQINLTYISYSFSKGNIWVTAGNIKILLLILPILHRVEGGFINVLHIWIKSHFCSLADPIQAACRECGFRKTVLLKI